MYSNTYNLNVAMKNKKLIIIRKKLDKLDNKFLALIKKRTQLVNQVLKTKKHKKEIIDNKRTVSYKHLRAHENNANIQRPNGG